MDTEEVWMFGFLLFVILAIAVSASACEIKNTHARKAAQAEACKAVMSGGTDAAKLQAATMPTGACSSF